ncbi:MAG: pantetheine-phosphate adenylyltransferase [Bacteroidetes bacterium]|nr:pantetheine-phosphate adenylyltransferase [Bacteroidota bacterium]
MKKTAVFPGTFDPITLGHADIVQRATGIFDEVVVAVGKNSKKQNLFPLEQRMQWILELFKDYPGIRVESYEELTVAFCRKVGASYIIRGLRSSGDFEYEAHLAQVNRKLDSGIETIFLITSPELNNISSTVVRDIIVYGGDYTPFVPSVVRP